MRLVVWLAVFLIALSWGGVSTADENDRAPSRRIGDATFLLPALADSAFILTEVGLRQDVKYQHVPRFPIGPQLRFDVQWAELDEHVDLSLRLFDWLALYAQGNGSGTVGMNMPSLAFGKTGYTFGGKAGFAVRALRSEASRTQLTLRAYAAMDNGRALDLIDLAGAVSFRGARDLAKIVAQTHDVRQLPGAVQREVLDLSSGDYTNVALTQSSSWTAGGSAHLAQALVGPLALQAAVGVERTESKQVPFDPELQSYLSVKGHETSVLADVTLSIDFNRWRVPVGVTGEYAVAKTFRTIAGDSVDVPASHDMGGGLFYTGRPGLELGVVFFTLRNLKPVPGYDTTQVSDTPVGYRGAFVLRVLL